MATTRGRTPETRRRRPERGRSVTGGPSLAGPPARRWVVTGPNLDPATGDQAREHAAVQLKKLSLFRNLSRRLLIDVAERSLAGTMRAPEEGLLNTYIEEQAPAGIIEGPARTDGPILAIVVLKGTLIAANPSPSGGRDPIPSPLPSQLPTGVTWAVEIPPGVYPRHLDERLVPFGEFRLEPAARQQVEVLIVSTGGILAPAAAWGTDLKAITNPDLAREVERLRRPELIWMATSGGSNVPVEALTHVLAGAMAQTYPDENTGVVVLGAASEVLRWNGRRFTERKRPLPKSGVKANDLYSVARGRRQRGRVFVLNGSDTMTKPTRLQDVFFDRVLYLTDDIPPALPTKLDDLINPKWKTPEPGGAYFSSFVPCVSSQFTVVKSGAKKKKFKPGQFCRKKAGGNTPDEEAMITYMRCVRDTALMTVDSDLLAQTYADWQMGGGTAQPQPFLTAALGSGAISNSVLNGWGRAVANRRVGVACSGGGASAFRIGAILEEMEKQGVPVDVFAGLSGGALVGAFYSRWGMDGFHFSVCLGPFFQLTLPLVLLWTRPMECVMDFFLDNGRVEELDIRFAAVSAALPEETPPQTTVVINGTLGEAIRVSGSLPPSFAPSDKDGVRYTDGGAGTAVPAQVARDCGADVVLSCNAIPGPARGNPFTALGLGFIRRIPLFGRSVDNYTWHAYFMQQTSREFGASADEFFEFDEQDFPMLEATQFISAKSTFAKAQAHQPRIKECVERLFNKWQAL